MKPLMGELALDRSISNVLHLRLKGRKMRSEIDFRIITGLSATSTYAETPVIAMAKEQIEHI